MKIFMVILLLISICIAQNINDKNMLKSLNWLAGYWTNNDKNIQIEEIWLPPSDSVMIGMHLDTNPSGGSFFEYLRIQQNKNEIIYYASPSGKPAIPFTLIENSAEHLLFENKTHDFPQRILYKLVRNDQLLVQISGNDKTIEWLWYKTEFKP